MVYLAQYLAYNTQELNKYMIIKINLFYDLDPLHIWIRISFCKEASQATKNKVSFTHSEIFFEYSF